MLTNRLSRLMGERRLNIQQVAEGTGLTRKTVGDLYHAKTTRIDLDTLNRLCAFFDVEPGDIFEWRRMASDPAPTTATVE